MTSLLAPCLLNAQGLPDDLCDVCPSRLSCLLSNLSIYLRQVSMHVLGHPCHNVINTFCSFLHKIHSYISRRGMVSCSVLPWGGRYVKWRHLSGVSGHRTILSGSESAVFTLENIPTQPLRKLPSTGCSKYLLSFQMYFLHLS